MSEIVAEFDALFLELTGIAVAEAERDENGFLFVPPEVNLGSKSRSKRSRITELAGPNSWRNHIVDDEYAGWWIKPPT